MSETDIVVEGRFSKESGEFRTQPRLSPEDREALRALNQSPYWKRYRQLLIATKEAHMLALIAMRDPNDMIKEAGLIAGLNLSINMLPVLCLESDKAEKKAIETGPRNDLGFKPG